MLKDRLPRWIPLKSGETGEYAIVEQQDYERVRQYHWFPKEGFNTTYARSQKQINNKKVPLILHRFIMDAKPGEIVDHINRNGLDCRRSNLRIVPRYVNHINVVRKQKSNAGYRGVHKRKWSNTKGNYLNKPFSVAIQVNGKCKHLGYYATAEEGARAYDIAAKKYHGQYAMLNFPN